MCLITASKITWQFKDFLPQRIEFWDCPLQLFPHGKGTFSPAVKLPCDLIQVGSDLSVLSEKCLDLFAVDHDLIFRCKLPAQDQTSDKIRSCHPAFFSFVIQYWELKIREPQAYDVCSLFLMFLLKFCHTPPSIFQIIQAANRDAFTEIPAVPSGYFSVLRPTLLLEARYHSSTFFIALD